MIHQITLTLSPREAADPVAVRTAAARACGIRPDDVTDIVHLKRSIDARSRHPKILLLVDVYVGEHPAPEPAVSAAWVPVADRKRAIIVGAGPAGYFAALELIENGIRPVIFDRGRDVQARRRDLRAIQQFGEVNPHSNYCFGEGGAGTYSDGKLYTRSHKRGDIRKALRILVEHGARTDILVDAHPHIGSNKLPKVVQAIRETILRFGGEIHFNAHVTGLVLDGGTVTGVRVNDSEEHCADAVILATGHSARDVFTMLHELGVEIETKPFALGVRVEHPQELIDEIQYRQKPRDAYLPASSYKLVAQVQGRGVFSFCMCPGGLIVPAATAPGELVVNGMSMSRRDSAFANSGIVVAVENDDLHPYRDQGVFAGVALQQAVETAVFRSGADGSQKAPAQRLVDFTEGKLSASLPATSYIPGLHPAPLHELLPSFITERLRGAFVEFGKKMRGYYTNEANVVATESRTSSPIRIPRDPDSYMHVRVRNLYPCGEGAGYAGGIISAALDGQNVARAVVRNLAT